MARVCSQARVRMGIAMTRINVHRHPRHQARLDDEHARWARRAAIDRTRGKDPCMSTTETPVEPTIPPVEPDPEQPDDDELEPDA